MGCQSVVSSRPVLKFAQVSSQGIRWMLKRNCAMTPVQLAWAFVSIATLSLGIGLFFWTQGAYLVLPFAGIEVLLLGVAFVAYARHAADGELISLQGQHLVIEFESAGRRERAEFARDWVRVEPHRDDASLIEVSGHGRVVRVGRYVRPELRPLLAREIRWALRTA